jgi:chromosome segregation protein
MYISKLEIFGFKSFAHKTQLSFGEGITSIVGPNGCGKTNVVDAIRWVLGEQKSTLLRSDVMTDVIFNGSKHRKPLNYSEVSLTIHNNRGVLGVAYNEVIITRRLYRDGTSEYLLNNTPVRLKDIHDLFVDTGMGSDAYSVMELRMVEDILSENKDSRKHLFEEAAGINKYKSQRKSAYRKLDATREDLERLDDILYEIKKNVSGLKRQLNRYEKYQEYADQLRDLEVQLGQKKWFQIQDQITPLQNQLERNQVRQNETSRQLGIEESMLTTYRKDEESLSDELDKRDSGLGELNQKITDCKSRSMVLEEKIQNARNTLSRLQDEREMAVSRKLANEKICDDLRSELEKNDPRMDELRAEYETVRKEFEKIQETYKGITEKVEKAGLSVREKQSVLNRIDQKQTRLLDQQSQFRELMERDENRRLELEQELTGRQTALSELESTYESSGNKTENLSHSLIEKEKMITATADKRNDLREKIMAMKSRYEQTGKELEFYRELVESMTGFNPGVRYVLKELKHAGIQGTVADLLHVKPDYATAIEIALGNVAKYLVADTKDSALDVIDDLKKNRKGRVTVIPLDLVKDRLRQYREFTFWDDNVIGLARDYVTAESGAEMLIDYFLNDVVLVQALRRIPQKTLKESRFRFVTPDGDYLEQRGLIKGGKSDTGYQNIIGRREKIKSLEKEKIKLNTAINKLESSYLDRESDYRELIRERDMITAEFKKAERERLEGEKELSQLRYTCDHLKSRIKELNDSISRYSYQIKDSEAIFAQLKKDRNKAEREVEETREALKEFQSQNQGALKEKDDLFKKVQDIRVRLITEEREKDNTRLRYNNAEEIIQEMTERIRDIDENLKSARETLSQSESELQRICMEYEKYQDLYRDKDIKRNLIFEKLKAKRDAISKVELSISEQHKTRENYFQTLRDIEIRLSDLQSEQNRIRERILERYRIDILKQEYQHIPEEDHVVEEKIERLRHRIEMIGPVNMAVKTEYEDESARLTFLTEQRDDLLESEKSILETIQKLDTTARKQFRDVFDRIRQNFTRTYELFFPHGSGDVRLKGDPDPLEAEIEILSRPKGKEMKSLRSLSAGEKALTAIALLFAIYLVKPSPYCILDEVDAPLDDQNVGRFTQALKHFTERTQFIIVTHNKLTMEAADYMYGVTMQEEGVSKIVSVHFSGGQTEALA